MDSELRLESSVQHMEVTRLRKKILLSEAQWSKDKAIQMQRIQMQQQQIQSLIQREKTQKNMYESIIATYGANEQKLKTRKDEVDFIKKQIDELVETNRRQSVVIQEFEVKIAELVAQKMEVEETLSNEINTLKLKLEETETQLGMLAGLLKSENRKSQITKQRQMLAEKQNQISKMGVMLEEDNEQMSRSSLREDKRLDFDELGPVTMSQLGPALNHQEQMRTKEPRDGQSQSILLKYLKDSDSATPSKAQIGSIVTNNRPPQRSYTNSMKTGIIMSVREYNNSRQKWNQRAK